MCLRWPKDIGMENWRHICVDMQRMFAEDTPWKVDWMEKIAPQVTEVASRHRERTIFSRFLPPLQPADAPGMWRPYYEKWWMMTQEHLPGEMLDLIAPLAKFSPPAAIFNKRTYSPWINGRLQNMLIEQGVETLAITGGETDVCVLATVLGAIDLGYRVTVLSDAICSGTDETHDASLTLLDRRYSAQLNFMTTEQFLSSASVLP